MTQQAGPLVFISYQTGDLALASAFAELIHDVSAGRIRCFVASDKSGRGIAHGDEWYAKVIAKLQEAEMLVAILTPASIRRPWILFEAGFVRGKGKKVAGIAMGLSLAEANVGPFKQFENLDLKGGAFTELVREILAIEPGNDPSADSIKIHSQAFLERVGEDIARQKLESAVRKREERDWSILRSIYPDLREVLRTCGNLAVEGKLNGTANGAIASVLSDTVLVCAQRCVEKMCSGKNGAACCLKIAESKELIRCLFPPGAGKGDRHVLERVEADTSYAGLFLAQSPSARKKRLSRREKRIEEIRKKGWLFVPSWQEEDLILYTDETRRIVEDSGVHGFAVLPVKIRLAEGGGIETVAVLKVDFRDPDGLVDDLPLKILMEKIADVLAVAFQFGIGTPPLRRPRQPEKFDGPEGSEGTERSKAP